MPLCPAPCRCATSRPPRESRATSPCSSSPGWEPRFQHSEPTDWCGATVLMRPEHYAWLSAVAALATIALKSLAWWLTGSVGLLSDALESFVNLAAALLAVSMLRLAAAPPDEGHQYGHSKAEYFSPRIEATPILSAPR